MLTKYLYLYLLGAKILLGAGYPNLISEILFVLKQNFKVTFVSSVVTSPFPKGGVIGAFGEKCGETILIGYKYDLYEFKLHADRWVQIDVEPHVKYNRWYAKSCILSNMMFLCGGYYFENTNELFQYDEGNTKLTLNPSDATCPPTTTNRSSSLEVHGENRILFVQNTCSTKLPLNVGYGHTITNIGHNRVMLIGGFGNGNSSNRVFQGELSTNRKDVMWNELECLGKARRWHISFKMNGSVYVAGGYNDISNERLSTCERYDLKEMKWYKCQHSLPFALRLASVVVSTDESIAVITGGKKEDRIYSDKVIIFTEDKGFVIFKAFSLRSVRYGHVSIRIQ